MLFEIFCEILYIVSFVVSLAHLPRFEVCTFLLILNVWNINNIEEIDDSEYEWLTNTPCPLKWILLIQILNSVYKKTHL